MKLIHLRSEEHISRKAYYQTSILGRMVNVETIKFIGGGHYATVFFHGTRNGAAWVMVHRLVAALRPRFKRVTLIPMV